ncbi:MAG: NAD(P)-dependent oxidoreductase [Rhodospirillaceae bacterium]|nr:NAD(P)-dependent oxidoreductase [Rhodospirillaceae bacterium]
MARVGWITGGAGFIGTAVARRWRTEGWRVLAIDRRAPEAGHPLAAATVVSDVTPVALAEALSRTGRPDALFHAAGTGTVGRAEADPVAARIDTVGSVEAVLAFLAGHAPACRLIIPSSAAVYGDAGDRALREDMTPAPISVYGQLKHAVEQRCAAASDGLNIGVIRFFSVYGPGLRKQLPWELGRKFLGGAARVELSGTGGETRDFLHIDDAVALIHLLATTAPPGLTLVNGGTGVATTIRAFATGLGQALGSRAEIAFSGAVRAGDPAHYRAETARVERLGFRPAMTLTQGLADYARWLRSA